jgi:hypothetical protein
MGLRIQEAVKKRLRDVCQPAGIDLFEAVFPNGEAVYEFRKVSR